MIGGIHAGPKPFRQVPSRQIRKSPVLADTAMTLRCTRGTIYIRGRMAFLARGSFVTQGSM